MTLKMVTFTGVDERTDKAALIDMSERYPFIEWGLLLSRTGTGKEPRYPTVDFMHQFGEMRVRKALHLCGGAARDFAASLSADQFSGFTPQMPQEIMNGATRLQVNLGRGLDNHAGIHAAATVHALRLNMQIIVQAYDFRIPPVKAAAGELQVVSGPTDPGAVFLNDASGGTGLTSAWQQPVNPDFVGFAGGLNPDNVVAHLESLGTESLGVTNPFWIDMESGVRTNDWFDLAKVEAVCEAVKEFVRL